MNTVAKSMDFVRMIDSPYLQVYPDIGNIKNGADDAVEDILNGRGHIVAAHLKETRPGVYRDLMYGEGRVDFPACIDCLKTLGVRIYNAEFWYKPGADWHADIAKAAAFLRPLLGG